MFNYQTEEANSLEEFQTIVQSYDGSNWELISVLDHSTKMNTIIILTFKKKHY